MRIQNGQIEVKNAHTDGCGFRTSRQIRPAVSMFGWYILVRNRTLGGSNGYLSGTVTSSLKTPPEYGVSETPRIVASSLSIAAGSGHQQDIPGGGSRFSICSSFPMRAERCIRIVLDLLFVQACWNARRRKTQIEFIKKKSSKTNLQQSINPH
jgi:hypothetical protein